MFGNGPLPINLYWCELNQQIVVRYPTNVSVKCNHGRYLHGMGYKDIRSSMTFIGTL